ncbi:MAG: RDD family protein, partial [Pseudomonadota bacterium]|nr:RDD family protein [Pseudomonadota bacterium]
DATVSNVIDSPNRPSEKNGANDDIGVNEQAQNKGVHENGLQEAEGIESDRADFDDATSEPSAKTYSIVAWIKGLITELGLGFGWAALYYSVFTAWFNGKTPGKRLLNIQVLKLDGSGLSLWESFGRYGGYGAGLATGLLGFVQIYWDPNRQAIQDKISETLVISTRD